MSADPRKYKPLPISQRDTLLASNGVDDCRAVSATYLAAAATLGDIFITARGNQMGRRGRTALVKKARASLGPALATGPLNTSHTTAMLQYLVPDAPKAYPLNLTFPQLKARLQSGSSASLSGNPSHIKGASPLKRVGDVGHELFLWGGNDDRVLVGDPYKPYSRRFGEWLPWTQVRQFAYKDSDATLTAVFVIDRGAWTEAELEAAMWRKRIQVQRDKREDAESDVARLTTQTASLQNEINALTIQLAECREDGSAEAVLDQFQDLIDELREDA